MEVIEQEGRRAAVSCPPGTYRITVDGLDQLAGKLVGAEACHRAIAPLSQRVTDRMEQVSLPDSAGAHHHQWVVAGGRLRHYGASGLHRHTIAGALDQIIQLPERGGCRRRMS